ncbi:MAG: IS21-like element helper ATPase IstB [Desulfatirhabdiaceae bacterium]
MREKIRELLRNLSLKGIEKALEQELNLSEKEGTGVAEVLYRLLCEESAHRQHRSMLYRLNGAKIPYDWTLKTFPFHKQPGVKKTQIMSLASLSFIEQAQNIVFIGNPGTGKTGLAIGLLRQALVNGCRGRFYNAQDLLDELYASLADRSTAKLVRRICNYPVLVIDELGYLTLKPEQINAFFKLMGERYGKATTIITTNLDYPDWYDLFQKKSLVDALLDRLKHRCITVKIDGPSLRSPSDKKSPS